jgi:PAS domain S-box-containing protein
MVSMAEDPEYVLEPLREGADLTLYRGKERGNHRRILAVAVAADQPSPQSIRRLEHEYSLATKLDAAWAAQPLTLTRHQGRAILVLEDPGGEFLDRIIDMRQAHNLTRFLRIAIGLAAALGQAHQQGLIHKDINPANALVDDSDHVWLTGFGIASTLPHERQVPAPPEILPGTLAYISPEQTGRMNRSMDSRSDLYSLGVTLYQVMTGELPFAAADSLEWVHCHIARQPVALAGRREAPEQLSAIIMRLLAKNPEERYQTAAGLEADLRRCLTQWQSKGRIDPFTLGADDSSDRLFIPEKLYGREREIDVLLAALDRVVAQGTTELVLVSGYSGVGKSSVVHELHKVLVPPRGLFAAGKFDQYKRDVPYATLAQAIQMLVREILVKSEAEVVEWRYALLQAVGPNGQLMVNLIPELEFVIGKQLPVAELPPQEARGRFQLVIRRLIGTFARPEHPLALFLDDLQWLDMATLDLLESLITDPDLRHLLLIGAYRGNEVSSAHPLMLTLAAIREVGARTQEIVLAPLRLDDLERLIAESLCCDASSAAPLANLVYEKTGGNPFFAIQLLTSLAEEGLLRFDRSTPRWIWDLDRIRAKGYSGNVVDLMVGKLRRLPATTQAALRQIACLGNAAEIATLSVIFGQSEDEIHTALQEAVRNGLILRLDGSYAFPHDRVQEGAYALIPEFARAKVHLGIGRLLLSSVTAEGVAENLFNVANQLNRGANLLIDHDEKVHVATIDLRAGRKAKASAAYTSARAYFAAGMALLDEGDWSSHYELQFNLSLECAECELVCGNGEKAQQLIAELLPRAATRIDEAAVYRLKILSHIMNSDDPQAVATALTCLRRFGFDIATHPTEEQVQAEYEALRQDLDARPIESLIDLPLMTDPELQAAMRIFSVLTGPAYFTDFRFWRSHIYRMIKISLLHGTSNACIMSYSSMGTTLSGFYHRYGDAYRFNKLACDVAEKHEFIEHRTNAYLGFGLCAVWTQPIAAAIDLFRKSFRVAIETGDLYFACTSLYELIVYLLLRNDPLDVVQRETDAALEFTRRAKYGDIANIIVIQQRLIATMQGRTASFSTFSDAQFDEAAFEERLASCRMPILIGWYWILKLKTRFLSGNFADALAAADKARPLLDASVGQVAVLDYYLYAALTLSALYETASVDEQRAWGELLKVRYQEQLREWAHSYPPTFGDKYTLILAEIARLEKRDVDAQRLYERTIHSAREHGFVQNEGLAHELAGQYYLSRGLETAGYAHLRSSRNCYERWGAHGKVKQLDHRHPRLREGRTLPGSATALAPLEPLDVATVLKTSQAISSEMLLPALIEKLVRIAVEHAGAERGLLILLRGGEPRIEAEAVTGDGRIAVTLRQAAIAPSDLPQSTLHYVIRTRESVLLDDASTDGVYSKDAYVQLKRSRSVLCLPIVKQAKLVGALYLENNLTPCAFTSDRVTVLDLLASQAAISLENATLYSDLQRSEAFLSQAQRISQTGSFNWNVSTGEVYWSEELWNILQWDQATEAVLDAGFRRVHPDDRAFFRRTLDQATKEKTDLDFKVRFVMTDGRVKHVHIMGHALQNSSGDLAFVGAVRDITERVRAEETLRQAQDDLARINRASTMGELTASLAHELSQPISGALTNANTCLRKLAHGKPDLDGLHAAVTRIARDARRASEIIARIRSQFQRGAPRREIIDINEITRETVALLRDEVVRYNISVRTDLAADLPRISGDRVQLQQVAMNLIFNSIEAMKDVDGRREMLIKSQRGENDQILVSLSDTGIGFPPELAEQIFDPFYTTKPQGTGMGLRISRSIVESHSGRLWAVSIPEGGAAFHLSLPAARFVPQSPATRQC